MRFQKLQGAPYHIPLAPISEFAGSFVQRNPGRAFHLDPHFGSNVIDDAGVIAQQKKRNDLEDPLPVPPGSDVDVLDVRPTWSPESRSGRSLREPRAGRSAPAFRPDPPVPWAKPVPVSGEVFLAGRVDDGLDLGLDNSQIPAFSGPFHHHAARGNLPNHGPQVSRITGVSHGQLERGLFRPEVTMTV